VLYKFTTDQITYLLTYNQIVPLKPVAVLGKNIWGAWPLIIWEATTAKRD